MRRLLLLVLLATGCERELVLPAEPQPLPVRREPALLGKLAGDYELDVVVGGDGAGLVAPVGYMRLMHLVDPRGVDEENVLGFGALAGAFGPAASPGLTCEAFINASFDGTTVAGTIESYSCDGETARSDPINAIPVAGVAGFTTDLSYHVCPGSRPRPLRARRRCEFNPSISGVYQGTATSCDGTVDAGYQLALGFTGAEVTGFSYPLGTDVIFGEYDAYELGGPLTFQDIATGETTCAAFTLRESGGELLLTVDSYAGELVPYGPGPDEVYLDCAGRAGCAGQRIEATRLAGGEEKDCESDLFATQLFVIPQLVRERHDGVDYRFLDVVAVVGDGSAGVVPPFSAELGLLPVDAGVEAPEQIAAPAGVTARFALAEACDPAVRAYEVYARVGAFEGGLQSVAPATCVIDGPIRPGAAVEHQPCPEAGAVEGALTCVDADGQLFWARYCETTAACREATSICYADSGFPICYLNGCEAASRDGAGSNGALWSPCDSFDGKLDPGEQPGGLCVPHDSGDGYVPICVHGGDLPPGSPCLFDGSRNSPGTVCQPGTMCIPDSALEEEAPCGCDAECAATGPELVCDLARSLCSPIGHCLELCDAGPGLAVPGTPAGCDAPGATCYAIEAEPASPHPLGICF